MRTARTCRPRACATTSGRSRGTQDGMDRSLFCLYDTPAERIAPRDWEAVLRRLVRDGVRFVLVGDRAGAAHGCPFESIEADVCYDVAPDNLARLAHVLRDLDARPRVPGEHLDPDALPHDGVVRLMAGDIPVDLVATPLGTGGYDDLAPRAVRLPVGDVEVPVASLDDLIRMKTGTPYPKDVHLLAMLLEVRDGVPVG